MGNGLKVGIVGASGIGQHHARWHTLCGSEVVGFVGTSEASVARTRKRLEEYFGFAGRGYTRLSDLLAAESPDIVAVTSPYTMHDGHVEEALDAGAHVLCEKPLFWDEEQPLDRILQTGREMAARARASDRLFSMTAQYPACLPMYRDLYARVRGEMGPVEKVEMEMEVRRRGDRKLFEANWIDVASHPLSLVIASLGVGRIEPGSAFCAVEEAECSASFTYSGEKGAGEVSFVIRDIVDGTPLRRFGLNGFLADWDGFPDDDGIYRASLSHGATSVSGDDFLHTLIASFTQSVLDGTTDVPLGPDEALLNLEMQVDLLALARGGSEAA